MGWRIRVVGLALGLGAAMAARGAESLSIAGAANLGAPLEALTAEFTKGPRAPDVKVALGASGSLVAQITNGAPYDVLLSADPAFADALVKSGNADPRSLAPFAVGRLVLWTLKPGLDVSDIAAAVRSPMVRALAIANTDSAPYGRAARQALEKLGLWADAMPKLVTAENISQAAQFVETGNADAGFVAMSAVLSPRLKGRGRWTEVPAALHEALVQVAVVTVRGSANPQSARFVAFLRGEAARRILEGFGYAIPAPGAAGREGP
jgi:molybdate transport system substrate-binding protein